MNKEYEPFFMNTK